MELPGAKRGLGGGEGGGGGGGWEGGNSDSRQQRDKRQGQESDAPSTCTYIAVWDCLSVVKGDFCISIYADISLFPPPFTNSKVHLLVQ